MRSVVITGASTGIGWATAKLLLTRGFRVFGSVRKAADVDRLWNQFGANFTPLVFDVTDEAAVLAAAREVQQQLGENGLPPEQIADAIANALTSARPKVRYAITPDPMRRMMMTILPKRTVDRIIAKRLGLMPSA